MEWNTTENLIYHIPKVFKYNSSIAIFNFIDTLIKITKSSIKFTYINVPNILYDIHTKKASIIIYQSFSHKNIEHIKHVYNEFLNKLKKSLLYNYNIKINEDIPIIVFFSINDNKFKKPFTGVWKMIQLLYRKQNKQIELLKCIMIGNLAGRLNYNKNKKDASASDRAFAHNINISFTTPDNFFDQKNKYKYKWEWDRNILSNNEKKYITKNKKNVPDIFNYINNMTNININTHRCFIIIITGLPFSGKTTLCSQLIEKWNKINSENSDNYVMLSDSLLKIDEINQKLINILSYFYNLSESESSHTSAELESPTNDIYSKKCIMIDIRFNYLNIISILKIIAKYKLYTVLIKPNISKKFIKLLNCIAVEKNDKTLMKKHEWSKHYIEINKLPNIKKLKYVEILEIQINPIECKEFWYEYSY